MDTLRERVKAILHESSFIDHATDAILALVGADAVRREREAFVAGATWSDNDMGGEIDNYAVEAEAARRYKEEK